MSLDAVLKAMKAEGPTVGQTLHADWAYEPPESPAPQQRSLLNSAVHSLVGTVLSAESNTRTEAENYLTEFVTAVPLFVGGRRGYLASALLFGLNEAKTGDSVTNQLADLGLGCSKGLATKCSMNAFGSQKNWSIPLKGLSMGISSRAIDTGLTRNNWFDQDGSAQPLRAIETLIMTSAHPLALATDVMTFGIAHGAVGLTNRITRGAIQSSPALSHTLTGTAFGFTSGALAEARRQITDSNEHPDLMKILARGGASAVTNAFSARAGFAINSLQYRPPLLTLSDSNAHSPETVPACKTQDRPNQSITSEAALSERSPLRSPLTPKDTEAKITEVSPLRSLGPYTLVSEVLPVIPPGGKVPEARTFSMRKYQVDGIVLTVPDLYAAQLDAIAQQRLLGETIFRPGGPVKFPRHEWNAPYFAATSDLAHYSSVIDSLKGLPDSKLVRQVRFVPFQNPDDPYWRTVYQDPTFQSGASADKQNGIVTYYRPTAEFVQNTNIAEHEWLHLLGPNVGPEREAYEHAHRIESDFNVSTYSTYNVEENWAEHGAEIINPRRTAIEKLARLAPIRTAVLCRAIEIAMVESGNNTNPQYSELQSRLHRARAMSDIYASSLASNALTNGRTLETRIAGAHLLGFLDDLGLYSGVLVDAAKTSSEQQLALASFKALTESTHGEWQGYGHCIISNESENQKVSDLAELAEYGSATRTLAIQRLKGIYDPRAAEFAKAATIDQASGDKIARVISVLGEIKDPAARQMALNETRRLVEENPSERLRLAHEIALHAPDLASRELDYIVERQSRSSEPILSQVYSQHLKSDPMLAGKAALGLDRLHRTARIERSISNLSDTDVDVRIRTLENLKQCSDPNTIRPLLQRVQQGTAAERTLAQQILHSHFSNDLVRFYARNQDRIVARSTPADSRN